MIFEFGYSGHVETLISLASGESKGQDKNIDLQAKNKFMALKAYAHENR